MKRNNIHKGFIHFLYKFHKFYRLFKFAVSKFMSYFWFQNINKDIKYNAIIL